MEGVREVGGLLCDCVEDALGAAHGAAIEAAAIALAAKVASLNEAMVSADVALSVELADDDAPRAARDLQDIDREAAEAVTTLTGSGGRRVSTGRRVGVPISRWTSVGVAGAGLVTAIIGLVRMAGALRGERFDPPRAAEGPRVRLHRGAAERRAVGHVLSAIRTRFAALDRACPLLVRAPHP